MVALSNLSKLARDGTEDKRRKMITNIFDSHGQRGLELDSISIALLKFAMRYETREASWRKVITGQFLFEARRPVTTGSLLLDLQTLLNTNTRHIRNPRAKIYQIFKWCSGQTVGSIILTTKQRQFKSLLFTLFLHFLSFISLLLNLKVEVPNKIIKHVSAQSKSFLNFPKIIFGKLKTYMYCQNTN